MTREQIIQLADKVVSSIASDEELHLYNELLEHKEAEEEWNEALLGERTVLGIQLKSGIDHEIDKQRSKPVYRISVRWVAAAVLLSLVAVSAIYFLQHRKPTVNMMAGNDLKPGGNKAVLMLADGSIVTLDSAVNGRFFQQGNTKVINANGQLAYNAGSSSAGEMLSYNTITTPRGGQYQVVLPDGTKVWLNAASSLKYPTAFSGKEREVSLKGEAYFEVTRNKSQPFIVQVNDMQVQVLGTRFDIMAYVDEKVVKTTLLEGAVKVAKGNHSSLLKPGEQASINQTAEKINIARVDVDDVIAWKEGLFRFGGNDITVILRQITRWYDVEVSYQGPVPEVYMGGEVSRNMNLSEVLRVLELSGVHTKLQGHKLVVMP